MNRWRIAVSVLLVSSLFVTAGGARCGAGACGHHPLAAGPPAIRHHANPAQISPRPSGQSATPPVTVRVAAHTAAAKVTSPSPVASAAATATKSSAQPPSSGSSGTPPTSTGSTASAPSLAPGSFMVLGSSLPFVAAGQTKVLTAAVTLPNGQAEATYNGPITLRLLYTTCAVDSPTQCPPINLWNGSRFVYAYGNNVTITVNAVAGVAQFKMQPLAVGQTTGAVFVASVPGAGGIESPSLRIMVVANNTAPVGFAFFTPAGTRISYQSPLEAVAHRAVQLTLRPVNALGQPIASTRGALVVLQAARGLTTSPSYTVPQDSFFAHGLPYFLAAGTQSVSVQYVSPVTEPQVLWASNTSNTAAFAEFIPPSGSPLHVVQTASGATVSGIEPHTTYTVVVDGPLPLPPIHSTPVAHVTVTSSPSRPSPALTSTPVLNQEGQWTFTYQSGSAGAVGDTVHLSINYWPTWPGEPLTEQILYSATVTTNPY